MSFSLIAEILLLSSVNREWPNKIEQIGKIKRIKETDIRFYIVKYWFLVPEMIKLLVFSSKKMIMKYTRSGK